MNNTTALPAIIAGIPDGNGVMARFFTSPRFEAFRDGWNIACFTMLLIFTLTVLCLALVAVLYDKIVPVDQDRVESVDGQEKREEGKPCRLRRLLCRVSPDENEVV
ncbi:unnamed protein product [Lampetra planeri]